LKLFQCRAKGIVWKNRDIGSVEKKPLVITDRIGHLLEECCSSRREYGKSNFPTSSAMTIASGSYFMEMATQGGRTAMVIFAPGPQSRDDIKFMLGGVDDGPKFYTLKRVLATSSGDAKCFLQG
jgi:hypothetical protein